MTEEPDPPAITEHTDNSMHIITRATSSGFDSERAGPVP